MTIHPIPPGLFCVPSALCALTGADPVSVIVPAINRHSSYKLGLHDTPAGVRIPVATAVLKEMRYRVRAYKSEAASGQLRAYIATWAARSLERWPDRNLLVSTGCHMLVICNGLVYDSWTPHGVTGKEHPFAKDTVVWAALVEPPLPR